MIASYPQINGTGPTIGYILYAIIILYIFLILHSFHGSGLLATSQSPQQFVDHRIVLVIPGLTAELSFPPPTVRHHFDPL